MSLKLAKNIPLSYENLAMPFQILTPVGKSFKITKVYRNCPLRVENVWLGIDLFPFDMNDFDLIVGMEWLGKRCVVMDCRYKAIKLFSSLCFISALVAVS